MTRPDTSARNSARAKPVAERFWPSVNKAGPTQAHMTTPCWEWTAGTDVNGYGSLWVGTGSERAHRASWILHNGPTGGAQVLHGCDNRLCVNPTHLRLGTNRENVDDKVARRRHPRGQDHPVNRGQANAAAKLTDAAVFSIRARAHDAPQVLAAEHGVSRSTIQMILAGKTWKHLTNPAESLALACLAVAG